MPFSAAKINIIWIITFQMTLPVRMMWYHITSRSTISKMNKRVSIVEPLPGWEDKEAVIDNRLSIVMPKRIKMWMKWHDNLDFSSEAGDLFHKLEVKEISRESVSWNHVWQLEIYMKLFYHSHHHHHQLHQHNYTYHFIMFVRPNPPLTPSISRMGLAELTWFLSMRFALREFSPVCWHILVLMADFLMSNILVKYFCPYRLTRRTQRRLMHGSLLKSISNYKALRPKLKTNP